MKYKLLGKDLPKLYKDRQSPDFHIDETFDLAEGDGWLCLIITCGELGYCDKDGVVLGTVEVLDKYDTDQKLFDALNSGAIEYIHNNWYEVQFFAETENNREYLDLTADMVAYSFDECIEQFKNCMTDENWCKGLMAELGKIKKGE